MPWSRTAIPTTRVGRKHTTTAAAIRPRDIRAPTDSPHRPSTAPAAANPAHDQRPRHRRRTVTQPTAPGNPSRGGPATAARQLPAVQSNEQKFKLGNQGVSFMWYW